MIYGCDVYQFLLSESSIDPSVSKYIFSCDFAIFSRDLDIVIYMMAKLSQPL